MKVGDSKKAVVLAVVAAVIVGMAVFRIVPQGAPAAATRTAAPAGANPPGAEMPVQFDYEAIRQRLNEDPFSNAKLKEKPGPSAQGDQGADAEARPPKLAGSLGGNPGQIPEVGYGPYKPDTDVIAGAGQESLKGPEPESKVQVVVQAVISVSKPRAIVSVNGAEGQGYSAGQSIAGWRVEKVSDEGVTIAGPAGRRLIKVGEGVKL